MPAEPQETIVLVAEQDEVTKAVRGVLECWAAEGLLKDVLWVDTARAGDTATVDGDIAASTQTGKEVWLLRQIAQSSAPVVRLVCAQFVPTGPVPDAGATAAARGVEAELRRLLAGRQEFRTVNVLVPSVATTGLTGRHLIGRWDVNVLVAPEDRVSDHQADQQVRPDGNYAAHAAAVCATVAGLWRGMTAGPFDTRAGNQHSGQSLVAARGYGRVLLAPGLVRRMLGELLQLRPAGSLALAHAAGGVPDPDPERTVSNAAERFATDADGGSLIARPPERREQILPRRRTLRETLRTVWRPWWSVPGGAVPALPDAWEQVTGDTDERTARWARGLSGSDGSDASDGAGRLLPERAPTADELATVSADMRALLTELGDTAPPPEPRPELWQAFREVAFGLADGGALPAFVEPTRMGGKRAIVLDPERIAPAPGGDVRQGATHDARDDDTQKDAKDAQEGIQEQDGARVRRHESLSALQERRERSFATAVAARLASQVGYARTAVRDSLRAVTDGPGGAQHQDAWARTASLARRWLLGLAVGAAASAVLGALLLAFGQRLWPAVAFLAGGPVAAAVGVLCVLTVTRELLARLARAHALVAHAYTEEVLAARHWAREAIRLATLSEQLRDWGEVVARILHDRDGDFGCDVGEAYDHPHEQGTLPHTLAFRFGVGEQTTEATAQLLADAIKAVFGEGWLSRVYQSCLERAESTMHATRGLEAGPAANDVDSDTHGLVRAHLLEVLRTGFPVRAWADDAGKRLVEELGRKPAAELFPRMRLLGDPAASGTATEPGETASRTTQDYLEELAPPGQKPAERSALNTSLLTPAGVADQSHHVRETVVWGLASDAETTATQRQEPLLPPVMPGGSYAFLAVRLDLTGEIPYLHLTSFEQTDDLETPYDPDAPDLG